MKGMPLRKNLKCASMGVDHRATADPGSQEARVKIGWYWGQYALMPCCALITTVS